ncbi:protein LONGIFOLIA 2-like [Andrographis paniculata]|uniref:protein LONGIFOLIA 2-like n=1 Tax=Andrographis paniculata TaxID=175694 RepID=UPI0021E7845F|nr:protein LONGIFOLIA 2-like [Andrographis paniculata]XP_051118728.1 protein LONGIFOLIA 2-like [Andrographis paniculata]XP_051118729.1 protein LONGIFOLIA 2-like [Andrographis paniculata]XP_051118730.1 protein LONGIFOLIA 2-like [Andrographis paniculata]
MSTEVGRGQNLEKQMGCMAGFLHIFDRNQISNAKRFRSPKRLPPLPPVVDTASESEDSASPSPAILREAGKSMQRNSVAAPSPDRSPAAELRSPTVVAAELPPKSPNPLRIFELKEGVKSSWKFSKETPRLSLDSRATTDANGSLHPKEIRTGASVLSNRCESVASDATDDTQQHRSPSVIARLMGLEPLPDSCSSEPENKPELRRSASESRVSRDLFNARFTADGTNLYPKPIGQSQPAIFNNIMRSNSPLNAHYANPVNNLLKNAIGNAEPPKGLNRGGYSSSSPWKAHQHRRSFFDSGDFFPEPKQKVSIHGENNIRLTFRGFDEPSRDLETLKQILEALQLKGLLHSRKPSEQNQISHHRKIVYGESPIFVAKIPTSSTPTPLNRKAGNDYSPANNRNQNRGLRRNYSLAGENPPMVSPRRDRNGVGRRSNSLVKPKLLSVETQKMMNESMDNRRTSPVHSPKVNSRRTGPDPTVNNKSPRSKKTTTTAMIHHKEKAITAVASTEDESSSNSGSSVTTSTDTERWKTEEYKEGRNLLERCDKLLHSIAEMTAIDTQQPSPVSVLDSSFYKDESSTPSPVTTKRNLDFKDESDAMEDESWSSVISPYPSKCEELSYDSDFVYVSDILRAAHYFPEHSDVFLLLEKEQYLNGKDTSKIPRLQRKLIFDTIQEILDRNSRLPPWKAVMNRKNSMKPSLNEVWSEFQRIREVNTADDLFETICSVLKKDLSRDETTGWGDCPEEMSEAILDIERQIFKDLVSDAIRDLAEWASRNTSSPPSMMMLRRKLVF